MEDTVKWHHKVPTDQEFALAMQELDQARSNLVEGVI
jgi:hypothetical protein